MTAIALSGNFVTRARIDAIGAKARAEMIRRAVKGARAAAPAIAAKARDHVATALRGNKAAKSIRAKVWSAKPNRFPAIQISSKIPWLGIHERGGTIRGRMLIQIGRTKGRRKAFLALVSRLMADGQAFFRKGRDGAVYLFAKPPKGTRGLSGARRIEREARKAAGGRGSIGRDEAFPIAMLVTKVTVRKRLRVEQVVRSSIPTLIDAMEQA